MGEITTADLALVRATLEFPVDELLRRGRPHLPYGEQVIDDLTPEEAEAFLDAILS